MITKIDHVVLTTTNLERCFTFYQKLGFTTDTSHNRYTILASDFKINVHLYHQELSPHATYIKPGS